MGVVKKKRPSGECFKNGKEKKEAYFEIDEYKADKFSFKAHEADTDFYELFITTRSGTLITRVYKDEGPY